MRPTREAPRDPVLPHLATALDEARMATVFQREFDAVGAVDVHDCAIERVKYRPGRSCIVAYRLTLRERDGRCSEQRLYAGLYETADVRDRYQRARVAHAPSARGLPGATLIAPLNMLVRWFPNDRKLPALDRLADAQGMQGSFVEPLARAHFGDGVRIVEAHQRVVSYFPEHSCTIAVECRLASPAGTFEAGSEPRAALPASGAWTLYGKARDDDAGAHTFLVMRALGASSAQVRGAVGYAKPLAYDPALRLLWQEGIPHPTLATLLDTTSDDDALCAKVGAAAAALHDTPLVGLPTAADRDWRALLDEAAAVLTRTLPALSAEVHDLHALLLRAIPAPQSADATVHGDLHANNILAGDGRIHFIDLDGVERGDGLTETCELLGELIERACLRGGRFDPAQPRALLHAYCAARGLRVDAADCAWRVAAGLLYARAKRCVTSLKPGRIAALPSLLATARTIVECPTLLEARP